MMNLTQFKLHFIFFAVIAFLDIAIADERCDSPRSKKGPCKGHLQRWTYDTKLNSCKFLLYGGCGATKNIFKTRLECGSACVFKRYTESSKFIKKKKGS